jgi:hypothetical protein
MPIFYWSGSETSHMLMAECKSMVILKKANNNVITCIWNSSILTFCYSIKSTYKLHTCPFNHSATWNVNTIKYTGYIIIKLYGRECQLLQFNTQNTQIWSTKYEKTLYTLYTVCTEVLFNLWHQNNHNNKNISMHCHHKHTTITSGI